MNISRLSFVAFFLMNLTCGSANAALVLDQENDFTGGHASFAIHNNQNIAQTFTVGQSGVLQQVDLMLSRWGAATGNFSLSILTTSGGVPDGGGSTLFSQLYPVTDIVPVDDPSSNEFLSIDVSSANISVSPGDTLALAVTHAGNNWVQWNSVLGGYGSGSGFVGDGDLVTSWRLINNLDYDLVFRTYVSTVPVPAAVWLFGSGLLGLIGVARRKNS